tara:strand:+ start:244805 stop:244990 length:186 start_codon:yes stop_codon:yes gene_type:complete
MDKLERNQQIISKGLRDVSRQTFWLGAAVGLLFGLIAGAAIGYNLGSPQTIVIPFEPGVEV